MRDTTKVFRQVDGDYGSPFDYGGVFINDEGKMRVIIGADSTYESGICWTDWTCWDGFSLAENPWIKPGDVESFAGMAAGELANLPQWEQMIRCAEYYGWDEFGCGSYGWTKWTESEFDEWVRFNA